MNGAALRWSVLALGALALILVPFALFESAFAVSAERALSPGESGPLAAAAIVSFLALDVFLPVPSSFVATASGMLLGVARGAVVTWVGMQAGALLGYALGRTAGLRAAARVVGRSGIERAEESHRRWGAYSLVASRAVPVLAEASVVLAGTARMPLRKFAALAGASNGAIAVVYAAVGAHALETGAFLLAFGASVGIPGALMWVHRRIRRSEPQPARSVAGSDGRGGARE